MKLRPNLSEAEIFYDYAVHISYNAEGFKSASDRRYQKYKHDSRKWLRLEQAASKRFVLRMVRIVESLEIPEAA